MARIFGGSASRLEVYALFVAAVVLIGGGIGGAIVVTSSDSSPTPIATAEATTTTSEVVTTIQNAPEAIAPPQAQTPRQAAPPGSIYEDPTPITVTPSQPIQDFSAYCTMPNLLRYFAPQPGQSYSGIPIQPVAYAIAEAGCSENPFAFGFSFTRDECIEVQMPSEFVARVIQQTPAAGTLVHKTFGRIDLKVAISGNGYDLSTPIGRPPFC